MSDTAAGAGDCSRGERTREEGGEGREGGGGEGACLLEGSEEVRQGPTNRVTATNTTANRR